MEQAKGNLFGSPRKEAPVDVEDIIIEEKEEPLDGAKNQKDKQTKSVSFKPKKSD